MVCGRILSTYGLLLLCTMKIKNAEALGQTPLRQDALAIAEAGLQAIDTSQALARLIRLDGDRLCVGENVCSLFETKHIFFVGIGKCAMEAGQAFERLLGSRLTAGIVLDVFMPEKCELNTVECFVGTHPMPSERNVDVTRRIVELLSGAQKEDLVIVFVSGGGSTLLCLPDAQGTCVDEQIILQELFVGGATIQEINTVRKHLSVARGGGIAKAAYPAQVLGLICSDVPGDDIAFIASGPTIKDQSTIDDAKAVLEKYHIHVDEKLKAIALMETPKEEKYFDNVLNVLLISNHVALEAMAREASSRGYIPTIHSTTLVGEAREVGRELLSTVRAGGSKEAHLWAGETTVHIEGHGVGGRNQELSLAALPEVHEGELLVSIASDGRDNSPAAGGICDRLTGQHAMEKSLDPRMFLNNNDSFTFFEQTGDAIQTGPTGSNVSDIMLGMKQ